ncbi:MAG: hypothetical protein J6Z49_08035 [Kiritimatiellae bacterium]|nr:hypothetical protein [Kiritimatiellia bacterium]
MEKEKRKDASPQPGNTKALRDALSAARHRVVETRGYYDAECDNDDYEALLKQIDDALAAPQRNCDVGTVAVYEVLVAPAAKVRGVAGKTRADRTLHLRQVRG